MYTWEHLGIPAWKHYRKCLGKRKSGLFCFDRCSPLTRPRIKRLDGWIFKVYRTSANMLQHKSLHPVKDWSWKALDGFVLTELFCRTKDILALLETWGGKKTQTLTNESRSVCLTQKLSPWEGQKKVRRTDSLNHRSSYPPPTHI